jgi:hypothetical protein
MRTETTLISLIALVLGVLLLLLGVGVVCAAWLDPDGVMHLLAPLQEHLASFGYLFATFGLILFDSVWLPFARNISDVGDERYFYPRPGDSTADASLFGSCFSWGSESL